MKTYFLADNPVVIVVCDSPDKAWLIERGLQSDSLTVQRYSTQQVVAQPELLDSELLYKVIWVVDPNQAQFAECLTVLQTVAVPVFVVALQPTVIETNGNTDFAQYARFAQDCQVTLHTVRDELPQAVIIGVSDLVTDNTPLFAAMTQQVAEQKLLDPQLELFPVSFKAVVQYLKDVLFMPLSAKLIAVHGKKYPTQQLLADLQIQWDLSHATQFAVEKANVLQIQSDVPYAQTVAIESSAHTATLSALYAVSERGWKPTENIPAPGSTDVAVASTQAEPAPLETHPDLSVDDAPATDNSPTQEHSLQPHQQPQPTTQAAGAVEQPSPDLEGEPAPVSSTAVQPATLAEPEITSPKTEIQTETLAQTPTEASAPSDAKFEQPPATSAALPLTEQKLELEIERIFEEPRLKSKLTTVKKKSTDQKKITKKTKSRAAIFMVGLVFVGIGFGVLTLIGLFSLSNSLLEKQLVQAAQAYEESQSIDEYLASINEQKLEQLATVTNWQAQSYSAIFDVSYLDTSQETVYLAQEIVKTKRLLTELSELKKSATKQLLGVNDGDMEEISENMALRAAEAAESLSLIDAKLQTLAVTDDEDADDDASADTASDQLSTELAKLRAGLAELQVVATLLPEISGMNGRKIYAVLLQNNQELRPTGGFIQAIALLTMENGTLIDTDVYSAYDKRLEAGPQVIPPAKVTELLGEERWYLRDTNWNPDFPATAADIKKSLEVSTGHSIDGVVALDGYGLQLILEQVGPIELGEYGETITDRNLFERLEFHSDAVLADKADFRDHSQVLLDELLSQIKQVSDKKLAGFLTAFSESLGTQHAQISFIDDAQQQAVQSFGWSGALLQPSCPTSLLSKTCVVEPYMQVEANIGINKANTYIERTNEHSVVLDGAVARHTRQLSMTNTAQSNSWPKGPYRTYIRFYLSPTARLESVQIDGTDLEVERLTLEDYQGRRVVGFETTVPIQRTQEIVVQYVSDIPQDSDFSYVFFDQKQSGLKGTPLQLSIENATGASPTLLSHEVEEVDGAVVFQNTQDTHLLFGVQYSAE